MDPRRQTGGQRLEQHRHRRTFGRGCYRRTGTAKSNMFDDKPTEPRYFYADDDSAGMQLDGNRNYRVALEPGRERPVSRFWSMTL